MAGMVDMPTSWELPLATKNIVMQDERNFERSTPDWAVTFPRDMSLADDKEEKSEDSSEFIKHVQTFLKSGPLGTFPYSGPIDGKISDHLIYTVIQFGWKLRDQTGKNIQMVSGKTIIPSRFQEAIALLNKKDKKENEEEEAQESNTTIASFQKYFKANGMYHGSVDGKPTEEELTELAKAAKTIEEKMASAIDNDEIKGKLWDDKAKNFRTTVEDLNTALKLIVENKKKESKKEARLSKNDRFLIFSYLNR